MNQDRATSPDWSALRRRLLAFVQARGVGADAAEDLVHEVLAKAFARLSDLRDPARLEAWLFQIARHAAVDYHRRARPPHQPLDPETAAEAVTDVLEQPAAERRLAPCAVALLETLPLSYREAVRAAELDGLTQREVGQQLGLSLSGAKSRVQRGRHMLRERVLECCAVALDARGRIYDYAARCPETAPCGGCASG